MLTVIIPLYNGSAHIEQALDSLDQQSLPLAEVIVVDDGSYDDGSDIARRHPLQPRIVSQSHAGVAVARNRGALSASTRYIAFLDQDDVWLRHRHQRLRAYLDANPACHVLATSERAFVLTSDEGALAALGDSLHKRRNVVRVTDLRDVDAICSPSHGLPRVLRTVSTRTLLSGTITMTTSYVFDRELFLACGGCVALARTMDDYLALLTMSRFSPIPILDEPSVLYRLHPESVTMTTEWALPLLTAIAAARFGGNIVAAGHARDSEYAGLTQFWRHWLLELARTDVSGLVDALALARLLASKRRGAEALALVKAWARARVAK